MNIQECQSHTVGIYIAGPLDVAKQVIREYCYDTSYCVTVEPTHYIYKGGEESGYVVNLRAYPRFPTHLDVINERAYSLAKILLDKTYQSSCMVQFPDKTVWLSKREE